MPELVIFGGPNGAGKTTAARTLLPQNLRIREFVNADEIARGLSPFNPEGAAIAAGRVMLMRMRALMQSGRSFAFETTCAGLSHRRLLARCQAAGYRATLIFLWLPSPEAALARVARRVREGGHGVPAETVVRRYWAGLDNLRRYYLPAVDLAFVYDNADGRGILVAEKRAIGSLPAEFIVHRVESWQQITGMKPQPG